MFRELPRKKLLKCFMKFFILSFILLAFIAAHYVFIRLIKFQISRKKHDIDVLPSHMCPRSSTTQNDLIDYLTTIQVNCKGTFFVNRVLVCKDKFLTSSSLKCVAVIEDSDDFFAAFEKMGYEVCKITWQDGRFVHEYQSDNRAKYSKLLPQLRSCSNGPKILIIAKNRFLSAPSEIKQNFLSGILNNVKQLLLFVDISGHQAEWLQLFCLLRSYFQYQLASSRPVSMNCPHGDRSKPCEWITTWVKDVTDSSRRDVNGTSLITIQKYFEQRLLPQSCSNLTLVAPDYAFNFGLFWSPQQWALCNDPITPPCLVLSISFRKDTAVERHLLKKNCNVWIFNPNFKNFKNSSLVVNQNGVHSGKNSSKHILSDKVYQEVSFVSLEDVIKFAKTFGRIDVLKLDIGGEELDVLETLTYLNKVPEQLLLVYHVWLGEEEYWLEKKLLLMDTLYHTGYALFYVLPIEDNSMTFGHHSPCCYVLGFIKTS